MYLPRPRLRGIKEVLRSLEEECARDSAERLPELDGKLKEAVLEDTAEYAGELVSAVERQRAGTGVHSWREGDLFTCMGWTRAQYPYYRDKAKRGKRWEAFGV